VQHYLLRFEFLTFKKKIYMGANKNNNFLGAGFISGKNNSKVNIIHDMSLYFQTKTVWAGYH